MIRLSSPPNSRMQALHPAIEAAFRDCRRAFWSVALFSAVVNLLTLAGPLYMLQVYDRVLASHSVPTLVALSVLLCGAFALQAAIDLIRSRVVTRRDFSTSTSLASCTGRSSGCRPPAGRAAKRTSRSATSIKSGRF